MSFTYVGLCSGVGMLERACEILGQTILAKRYPEAPLEPDVFKVNGADHYADVLVFGFPCQDVSAAGRAAGMDGERSGPLWRECFRVLSEMRPKIALIENVAMLKTRGLDEVLRDLASIGYEAEWDIISAAAVGAAHLRERIWIVARPAELAKHPVFSGNGKLLEPGTKIPRAGHMVSGDSGSWLKIYTTEPLAPRKLKRENGWSYWAGVDLLGLSTETALLPTPVANDDNKSPAAHMRMKARMPGGARKAITSLSVLGRNGFVQANGSLWPTPQEREQPLDPSGIEGTAGITRDARNQVVSSVPPAGSRALDGGSSSGSGPERGLWRTPCASDGSGGGMDPARRLAGGHNLNLVDQVIGSGSKGSLNPTWVEWLLSIPLGWTDPDCPTEMVHQAPWWIESELTARTTTGRQQWRKERLKAIGNSVCWPCAYFVLERALAATPEIGR